MTNPNNCEACEYKQINKGKEGHCYMFEDEPNDICYSHTSRNGDPLEESMKALDRSWDLMIRRSGNY